MTEPMLLAAMGAEQEDDSEFVVVPASEEEVAGLWIDLCMSVVFEVPLTRRVCFGHPILRSMSIIRSPRGTNFKVTPQEVAALTLLGY
jgi:hypothetical protein